MNSRILLIKLQGVFLWILWIEHCYCINLPGNFNADVDISDFLLYIIINQVEQPPMWILLLQGFGAIFHPVVPEVRRG